MLVAAGLEGFLEGVLPDPECSAWRVSPWKALVILVRASSKISDRPMNSGVIPGVRIRVRLVGRCIPGRSGYRDGLWFCRSRCLVFGVVGWVRLSRAGDFRTGLLVRLGILLSAGSVQNASTSRFFWRVCSAGVSAVYAPKPLTTLPCEVRKNPHSRQSRRILTDMSGGLGWRSSSMIAP